MFEFNAWATIAVTTTEIDNGRLLGIVQQIREQIRVLELRPSQIEVKNQNGLFMISGSGYMNHGADYLKSLLQLFEFIGEHAPGSYGILYAGDDEFFGESSNSFRVWVLKRGLLREARDPFLSPRRPVVEDAA